MNRLQDITSDIQNVSNNLRWNDIEYFCKQYNFEIKPSRKGYKVYVNNSIWCLHLEHRTSNKLKFGIIREFRKVLIKENIIK